MVAVTDITLESTDKEMLSVKSKEICLQYPDHCSIMTGQVESFIVFQIVASALFKKFHRDLSGAGIIELRYPPRNVDASPLTISDLFKLYPECEDYDTAYEKVSNLLVSVSAGLKENERDESAYSIFQKNDRQDLEKDLLVSMFQQEGISQSIYSFYLEELINRCPRSDKAGILTQIFLPKGAELEKVMYRSKPYGTRFYDTDPAPPLQDFFVQYEQGRCSEINPQLRFLVGGVIPANGFEAGTVYIYRYSCIPRSKLDEYEAYVKEIIEKMFMHYVREKNILQIKEKSLEKILDPAERKSLLFHLATSYIDRSQAEKALIFIKQLSVEDQQKILPKYIALLIKNSELEDAHVKIQSLLDINNKNKCYLLLILELMTSSNLKSGELDQLLKDMSPSEEKNLALLVCASRIEDKLYQKQLCDKYETDLEALYEAVSLGTFFNSDSTPLTYSASLSM